MSKLNSAGFTCPGAMFPRDLDLAGTVRASPYLYNTEEDVEKLLEAVREAQNIF
ncbi:hypothetical protein HRED_08321 [Candidatus Haloredivivus sp. G17]|nr:hypothetical protein HRED_08321 [Candidatus Haloredivivus sp. G17]